jgi:hypothetical protein
VLTRDHRSADDPIRTAPGATDGPRPDEPAVVGEPVVVEVDGGAVEGTPRRRWRGLLAALGIVAVMAGWWATLAPRSFGGPDTYVVVSGTSMLPRYHTGDLVVARRQSSYHLGKIVVVSVEGGRVIHRLWAGNARIGWETKGINRLTPDLWTIPNDHVLERRGSLSPAPVPGCAGSAPPPGGPPSPQPSASRWSSFPVAGRSRRLPTGPPARTTPPSASCCWCPPGA